MLRYCVLVVCFALSQVLRKVSLQLLNFVLVFFTCLPAMAALVLQCVVYPLAECTRCSGSANCVSTFDLHCASNALFSELFHRGNLRFQCLYLQLVRFRCGRAFGLKVSPQRCCTSS